jgi:hypothetical protein
MTEFFLKALFILLILAAVFGLGPIVAKAINPKGLDRCRGSFEHLLSSARLGGLNRNKSPAEARAALGQSNATLRRWQPGASHAVRQFDTPKAND